MQGTPIGTGRVGTVAHIATSCWASTSHRARLPRGKATFFKGLTHRIFIPRHSASVSVEGGWYGLESPEERWVKTAGESGGEDGFWDTYPETSL